MRRWLALAAALLLPVLAMAQDAPARQAPAVPLATAAPPAAPAERIVTGLSQDAVSINTSFTGSDILIYGAIRRDAPPETGRPLGIIVTVEGPAQQVAVRRKERVGGIWINTRTVRIGAAPDFYAVATSGRLPLMLERDEDVRHRISPALAIRALSGMTAAEDATPFTAALLALRTQAGRYRVDEGAVKITDGILFEADVRMPSNLVEGDYRARIFLVRDGKVIDSNQAPIRVRKVGLERWVYRLSLERPFWYGLLSLALAVAAGWGASAGFRALRRG
ncbi:TIGR02186 family protein [Paracoccus contaminans]|uniref:TIGR02186 family protein n=1 Tax=Paracoccus contaminans TaxID=1945662 RepID=A0A1W6CVH2_9RHOB|nr:TIGR02186 family protein [Paracoccus contaminans]ARJ68862.1 hypothetical protein B0A89_03660 [Paracoccus contaminans]